MTNRSNAVNRSAARAVAASRFGGTPSRSASADPAAKRGSLGGENLAAQNLRHRRRDRRRVLRRPERRRAGERRPRSPPSGTPTARTRSPGRYIVVFKDAAVAATAVGCEGARPCRPLRRPDPPPVHGRLPRLLRHTVGPAGGSAGRRPGRRLDRGGAAHRRAGHPEQPAELGRRPDRPAEPAAEPGVHLPRQPRSGRDGLRAGHRHQRQPRRLHRPGPAGHRHGRQRQQPHRLPRARHARGRHRRRHQLRRGQEGRRGRRTRAELPGQRHQRRPDRRHQLGAHQRPEAGRGQLQHRLPEPVHQPGHGQRGVEPDLLRRAVRPGGRQLLRRRLLLQPAGASRRRSRSATPTAPTPATAAATTAPAWTSSPPARASCRRRTPATPAAPR